MDRERIVQLFFFGFLAVMAYELYELMLPFLTPLAWGILLAFMAHPALIEVEKYVKRRSRPLPDRFERPAADFRTLSGQSAASAPG